jgi:hypothetical protein
VRYVAAAIAIVLAIAPDAAADDCPGYTAEQRAIDDVLRADAERATGWTWWWSVGYFTAGIGAAVVATGDDLVSERTRYGLYVTSIKALVGAYARIVAPLRVPVPKGCTADRALLAKAARKERNSGLLGVVGGFALNTAGLLYLGLARDDWRGGLISFASGTVVGVITLYTIPRRAWSLNRKLRRGGTVDGTVGGTVGLAPMVPIGGSGIGGLSLVGTW